MSDEIPTDDHTLWLGVINTQRRDPIVEAGGKAWWTRGQKNGKTPVIALVPDSWKPSFDDNPTERIPSGTLVESIYGNQFIVP